MSKIKAKKQTMFDEFQIKGYWWIPGSEEKVSGILFFNNDKIKLELLGVLTQNTQMRVRMMDKVEETKIILGTSENGEDFTLIDALNTNFSMSLNNGYSTETYTISYILVGGHFNTFEEIKFHSVSMTPTYFTKWMSKGLFSQVFNEKHHVVSINFHEPSLFKITVPSLNAEIEETSLTNLSGNLNDSVKWEYKGGLKIKPAEWQDFKWFYDIIFNLKNLYTLFIGYSTYFESITFQGEEEGSEDAKYRKKYHLFFCQKGYQNKIREKFNSHDAMISYYEIKDSFDKILNSWFEKSESLKSVYDIHFGDFYNDTYLETKFLNSVQTIEIFHRTLYSGKYFDEEEFNKHKSETVNYLDSNLPKEIAKRFKDLLEHGNEYSLSKRFREIIKTFDNETKSYIIGNSDSRGKFVQQLVDTRNYLTHYDIGEKKNVLKGIELHYAMQRLKAMTTTLLYKEIGVDERLILDKIKQSNQFSYAIPKAKVLLNK